LNGNGGNGSTGGDVRLNQTVRTMSYGLIWRLLRYPFVFLSVAFFVPLMGADAYGRYSVFMSVFLIWDSLTQVGNTQIFGRFLPEYRPDDKTGRSHFLHGIMFYSVLLAIAVGAAAVLFFVFARPTGFDAAWILPLLLLLILGKIQGTLFAYMYGLNQIGRFSARETMRSAFTFLFVAAFFSWMGWGINGAVWALVANEAALVVAGLLWSGRDLFSRVTTVTFREFKPYIMFGIAFYVPTLLLGLLQRSGNLFVAELTQDHVQVTCYDIGNQFLLLTGLFLRLFIATLIPSLAALHIDGRHDKVEHWQKAAMGYCGAITFLAVHALVLLGRPILRLWQPLHGDEIYRNALVMAAGLAPLLISQVGLNLAILDKKSRTYAMSVLLGFVAMAIACIALIPRAQSVGASVATVVGYTVMALAFFPVYGRRLWRTLTSYLYTLFVGVLFVPLYFIKADTVLAVVFFVIGGTAYVACLFILGIFKVGDIGKIVAACRPGGRKAERG